MGIRGKRQRRLPRHKVREQQVEDLRQEKSSASHTLDDPWCGLVQDGEELAVEAQILLREEYLERVRVALLPLVETGGEECMAASGAEKVAEAVDMDTVLENVDMVREATLDVVESIASWKKNQRGTTYLHKGKNYLLELPFAMDFACHIPEVASALGISSLERNPFILPITLPLPHAPRRHDLLQETLFEQSDVLFHAYDNRARICAAIDIVVAEEEQHGTMPRPPDFANWKELDELASKAHEATEKSARIEKRMLPKLANAIVADHNVHAFRRSDADGDGMLTHNEFIKAVLSLKTLKFDDDDEKEWLLQKVDPTEAGWVPYNAYNKICTWAKTISCVRKPRQKKGGSYKPPPNPFEEPDKLTILDGQIESIQKRRCKLEKEFEQVGDELAEQYQATSLKSINGSPKQFEHCTDPLSHPDMPRMHLEYPKANAKRLRRLLGDLETWHKELGESISQLDQQLGALYDKRNQESYRVTWEREIEQCEIEVAVMRRQERAERKRAAEEEAWLKANKRERLQKEAAEFKEQQRIRRKRIAREARERDRNAATRIQQCFRRAVAKANLQKRLEKRVFVHQILQESGFFLANDPRLELRTAALVCVITKTKAGLAILDQLLGIMGGGFFGVLDVSQCPIEKDGISEWFRSVLQRSRGAILVVPAPSYRMIVSSIAAMKGTLPQRPIIIDMCPHDPPESAQAPPQRSEAYLESIMSSISESLARPEPQLTADLESLPRSEALIHIARAIGVLTGDSFKDQTTLSSAMSLLGDPRRLSCKFLSVRPSPSDAAQVVALVSTILQSKQIQTWSQTASPAIWLVLEWVEASVELLSLKYTQTPCPPVLERPPHTVFDFNWSLEQEQNSPDIKIDRMIHFGLRDQRIFQHSQKDGSLLTLFRMGQAHVLVRSLAPLKDGTMRASYRIYNVAQLASHITARWMFPDEIPERAGELVLALRVGPRHRINSGHTLPSFAFAVPKEGFRNGAGSPLYSGTSGEWFVILQQVSQGIQATCISTQSPFRELRGITSTNRSLSEVLHDISIEADWLSEYAQTQKFNY
eukprot:CAMPEP_0184515930 /NCGR_PEP_ID=MMETSP0198_2-20121128/4757_1 /TAXON_ID=1112570 /ORGANISM="Thraustochytrium sp., Strain LLF1b" /LENGTH=1049 /DNA_ID=CAMNT_0026906215 /DNA_START=740 /DNA_END=3890 /DNA_ORIENTATION=+